MLPSNYTFTTADQGVHVFTVTLKTAGLQSITATDTANKSITGTESNITINPAAAISLTIAGFPNPATAGSAGNFAVTAHDPYGNVATGYTGTVHFTSSDPQAVLPANYTFTSTDAGVHSFAATLNTAGNQSIVATDSTTATITASMSVTVGTPGASATFIKEDTSTEGNWIQAYGSQGFNIIGSTTSYPSYAAVTAVGETKYTWAASTTDPRALQNASGTGRIAACWYSPTSFSVDVNLTDGQAHDVALYAVDWDKQGRSEQIQITSAATGAVLDTETLSNFSGGVYLQWELSGNVVITFKTLAGPNAVLSGLFFDPPSSTGAASDLLNISSSPTTDTAGIARNFTVTVLSPSGGTDTKYTGTIHFTSSDPQAVLPSNFTFTTALAGVYTFAVTLKTAGLQSVTATDIADPSVTGTESNITINPAPAISLTIAGLPNPATVGTPANFTVTAHDPYGNVATGYTGTVHFTSSDPQAALPANYTFTSTDAGIHSFSATLDTAGNQSIVAADSTTATITGSISVTVGTAGASAMFIKEDTRTEGNWASAYDPKASISSAARPAIPAMPALRSWARRAISGLPVRPILGLFKLPAAPAGLPRAGTPPRASAWT